MSQKNKSILFKTTAILVASYFFISSLVESQSFLGPLVVSIILAFVLIPLANRFEKLRLSRTLSSLCCTMLLFIVSLGFFALVTAQVTNVVDQWDTIKETMAPKIDQVAIYLKDKTPLTEQNISTLNEKFKASKLIGSKESSSNAMTLLSQIIGFFGTYLLVFIYVFFLIRFRSKFKKFIIKLIDGERHKEVNKTIHEIIKTTQGYLIGKAKLIALLAILYSIGLGVSGVSNFILIALLAAILTLIPYLGNVIGFSLAIIFGYLIQGDVFVLLGIIITFSVAQFVESYILQPYVVGDEVDLNPFFIILAVILGNLLWGITGMVIAIPVLAILNVIFLHVPSLNSFGYLLKKGD